MGGHGGSRNNPPRTGSVTTLSSLSEGELEAMEALINSQYVPEESAEAEVPENAESTDSVPWRERNGAQYPYLVRGAHLRCKYGSHCRRLNLAWSHGFYMGNNKETPLLNAMDCKPGEGGEYNVPPFGVCNSESCPREGEQILLKSETVNPVTGQPYTDANGNAAKIEENVKGYPCKAVIIDRWQNTHPDTLIGLKGQTPYEAVTAGSFLVCLYGGIIEPISTGQPQLDPPKMVLPPEIEDEVGVKMLAHAGRPYQNNNSDRRSSNAVAPQMIEGGYIFIEGKRINAYYDSSERALYASLNDLIIAYNVQETYINYAGLAIDEDSFVDVISLKMPYADNRATANISYWYGMDVDQVQAAFTDTSYKLSSNVYYDGSKQLVNVVYFERLMCQLGYYTKAVNVNESVMDAIGVHDLIRQDTLDNIVFYYDKPLDEFYMGMTAIEKTLNISELNRVLHKYDITSNKEIAFFLGQVYKESAHGTRTLERFNYGPPEDYFNDKYPGRNGNRPGTDDAQRYRGSGYIQLTGRGNYVRFANSMGDERILESGYAAVGGTYNRSYKEIRLSDTGVIDVGYYAWEAAGWFWTQGAYSEDGKSTIDLGDYIDGDSSYITKKIYGSIVTWQERNAYVRAFYFYLTGQHLDIPYELK